MIYKSRFKLVALLLFGIVLGCNNPRSILQDETRNEGKEYVQAGLKTPASRDTVSIAVNSWKTVFTDNKLAVLIDSALSKNQELSITMQEIEISKNEVRARKGEYLPSGGIGVGAGLEKSGEYTRNGAIEHQLNIKDNQAFPEPFGDFVIGAQFSWEIDIWKKLRNSKNAAAARYLGSVEGRNFMVTNLVSEIATSYYELLALDKQLDIINESIDIQTDVLEVVKQQKMAARVSQLAVNRFEAQLLNTQNRQYHIKQQIVETENKINFLVGRFPQHVDRNSDGMNTVLIDSILTGNPDQLLQNRPDIRKAEQELIAAKLDVKAAKANFYPTLGIQANVGFQAFNPTVLFNPSSLIYNLLGDLFAPLVNRNSIKATYNTKKLKKIQALVDYQKTILNAFMEVNNQLASVKNYSDSYKTKSNEVDILNQSVVISKDLFMSARADYMEVLLTQREMLEAKIELVETQLKEKESKIGIYKVLGGGWK